MNKKFANLVNAYKYTGSIDNYEAAKKEFMNKIDTQDQTHLSAYVEVKNNGIVTLRCFIHCTNANSKNSNGFFHGSKAIKIFIISCGNNITDMSYMFSECTSLTNLDLSNFITNNVTNMSWMFYGCSSLTELNLSSFNTNNVINMQAMFQNCSSLTNLNLSKFNTTKVTNMLWMFNNCFTEEQTSTLICQASTIQKITDDKYSCLTIENGKDEIKNTLNNNIGKVYTCNVERVEIKHQIIINIKTHITIVEYQITEVKEYKEVEKVEE